MLQHNAEVGACHWTGGPVPGTAAGHWCRIVVRASRQANRFAVSIAFQMADGTVAGAPTFLSTRRGSTGDRATGVMHVPKEATAYVVDRISRNPPTGNVAATLRPLNRVAAALLITGTQPRALAQIASAIVRGGWKKAKSELRRIAMIRNADAQPRDYWFWLETCEPLPPSDQTELQPIAAAALVFGDPNSAAFAATARSAALQMPPVPCLSAKRGEAGSLPAGSYAIVLQAGELLAAYSVAGACAEMARLDYPDFATADHDRVSAKGVRSDPVLTPTPNHALMLSGTPARGAWFIRADLLSADPEISEGGLWAEPARLAAWLSRYRAHDPGKTVRLPFFLSHRGPGTRTAPPALMARIVNDHLAAIDHGMRVRPVTLGGLPALRLGPRGTRRSPPVSILIPSTLTAPHFLHCLEQLLSVTVTPEIEIVVAAGQPGELNKAQLQIAAIAQRDSRVRVVHLPMPSFNYSAVNNQAALLTRHPLILLLNDDVAPIDPGWLHHMTTHLDDPRIGIVGPRLLYPSGQVQHGGVLMGLSGLCDHASRFLPGNEPGPGARVVLDQELSAVTGACLLIRRTVYDTVAGLDESYPSAFNDVDLCLRTREAGWAVIYAGGVALTHYELQTYGSHYAGERAAHRDAEIARFRRRWTDVVAVDPFHNPNLSLIAGTEWDLAFPPRTAPLHDAEKPHLCESDRRAPGCTPGQIE